MSTEKCRFSGGGVKIGGGERMDTTMVDCARIPDKPRRAARRSLRFKTQTDSTSAQQTLRVPLAEEIHISKPVSRSIKVRVRKGFFQVEATLSHAWDMMMRDPENVANRADDMGGHTPPPL